MHNREISNRFCRVCGLLQDEPPWGDDGKMPTFNICDCCGVEFGYEDATPAAVVKFRDAWIAGGAHWFNKAEKPNDWDLSRQLANIGI